MRRTPRTVNFIILIFLYVSFKFLSHQAGTQIKIKETINIQFKLIKFCDSDRLNPGSLFPFSHEMNRLTKMNKFMMQQSK